MKNTYYTKRLVHYQELYTPDDQEVVLTHCDYAEGMDWAETISIQRLKGLLQYVEGAGATHIALEYHPDHDSYLAAAYRINPATEQDLLDYETAEQRRDAVRVLDQQIQRLLQQQRELLVLIDDETKLKGNDLPF
jgi:hypothetical protein